jgi:hypothetical protein
MTKSAHSPPKFTDKYEERDYLKGRLAAAFRVFGKYGFDEGVAGTVCMTCSRAFFLPLQVTSPCETPSILTLSG